MKNKDLNTLIKLNNSLADPETMMIVNQAKIDNPAKEVEGSLVNFLNRRLEKIAEDNDFEAIIKNNIRQRLPEASFEELINLLHNVQMDNTEAATNVTGLFYNETSQKNLLDTLNDNSVSTAASSLYKSTEDKSILQAVTYLGQVMSQLKDVNTVEVVAEQP